MHSSRVPETEVTGIQRDTDGSFLAVGAVNVAEMHADEGTAVRLPGAVPLKVKVGPDAHDRRSGGGAGRVEVQETLHRFESRTLRKRLVQVEPVAIGSGARAPPAV